MESCDVLIVGGGPAGSSCAWKLRQAGADVVVLDRARFPRDKTCAGWITPQVLDDLRIDPDEYRAARTFQPITGFRVGLVGGREPVETGHGRVVSYGIRRCEFDDYLLKRSGARLRLGEAASAIERDGSAWRVNGVRAPVLVGAGGHFCPVARRLNGAAPGAPLVAAQEVEFPLDPADTASFPTDGERPELYFSPDLAGYGWCVRKGSYLNVGFGRVAGPGLPRDSADFVDFLKARGRIPAHSAWRWRGHAYHLAAASRRRAVDEGVLLVGDAAGLAYPLSGEGIRPAVESGLIAAACIAAAGGDCSRARLDAYARRIDERFGVSRIGGGLARAVPARLGTALARRLVKSPWFVRRVVVDRWFLHVGSDPGEKPARV